MQLIVDEFGEKLLEELDYRQEMRNIQEFYANFEGDPNVKIPWVRPDLCGSQTLVMEWVDGVRCTDPDTIQRELDVQRFIKVGVVSGLRQLLEVTPCLAASLPLSTSVSQFRCVLSLSLDDHRNGCSCCLSSSRHLNLANPSLFPDNPAVWALPRRPPPGEHLCDA